MEKKAKKNKILFSMIVSICSIAALIVTSKSNLHILNTACLWGLGCVYLAIGWYFLFWNYDVAQYIKIRNHTWRFLILLCSLLITGFLFSVLPFKQGMVLKNHYYQSELADNQTIQIRALGEKNEESAGYQVWLEGIRFGGSDFNLYELQLPAGWEFREDRPYTNQQAVSELVAPLSEEADYTLMLRRGPDAGMVELAVGSRSAVVDLYAQQEEQRAEVDLKQLIVNDYQPQASLWERILYNMAYLLLLWLLAFTCSIYLFRFCVREKHLKDTEGAS